MGTKCAIIYRVRLFDKSLQCGWSYPKGPDFTVFFGYDHQFRWSSRGEKPMGTTDKDGFETVSTDELDEPKTQIVKPMIIGGKACTWDDRGVPIIDELNKAA